MKHAALLLIVLFAGVARAEEDELFHGGAKLADDVLVDRAAPANGEAPASEDADAPKHGVERAPVPETEVIDALAANDDDRWLGTLLGAGLGGAGAAVGTVLGFAALIGVGYLGLTAVFALSPNETPTYTTADATSPFMLVIALGLLAQGLVLTLTTALALDTVTDFWRAAFLAPLVGALGVLGAPVGFLVVATVATLALVGVYTLVRGGSIGSNPGQATGTIFIGGLAGTLIGVPLGVVVSNLILPTALVAIHADPVAEWRLPFTSFSE
jgi:hypothetical protein